MLKTNAASAGIDNSANRPVSRAMAAEDSAQMAASAKATGATALTGPKPSWVTIAVADPTASITIKARFGAPGFAMPYPS